MSSRRRAIWLLGGFAVLAVAMLVAYAAAQTAVKGRIAEALGPNSETREIRVGLWGLELDGLRIRAPSGWPAEDALRADQLTIAPRLLTLFSGDRVRIRTIDIEAPYLSVLRGKRGGLEVLPGMFGGGAAAEAETEPAGEPVRIELGEIEIEAGVLELFDATVPRPPLKIRIEQIEATLEDLSVPDLSGKSRFELDGVVKGKAHDGRVHLEGWGEIGTRESSVSIELRGVDLVPLQPYLVRPGETSVRRGSVDLDMQSDVTGARLDARGTITISNLELASSAGLRNTFLGVSNSVVLAGMKDRGGKLTLDFTLSGDVDHPDFSLNEALGTKLALSLAETLGVSLGGLVEGVGSLGVKGGQAAGEAAKGVGGAIMDLFEAEDERK